MTDEEMAEEWVVDNLHNTEEDYINAFKDGAEYGYNKALEEATHNYNAIIADYDKRIAELEKENAELRDYNEKLLQSDIDKHNKIVLLSQKVKCLTRQSY